MSRTSKLGLALTMCLLLTATGVLAAGAASGATATASRACNIRGQERTFNTSYVTSLRVRRTTCVIGKRVVRAYHACRQANGGPNGRCPNRVRRYRCFEGRREGVPGVQYNARVVCRRGLRRVIHTYTQNV